MMKWIKDLFKPIPDNNNCEKCDHVRYYPDGHFYCRLEDFPSKKQCVNYGEWKRGK